MKISRRGVLKVSAVGSVSIAGCLNQGDGGDNPADTETPTPTETDAPTLTETPTPTETETPTPTPQPALYSEGDREEMIPSVEIFPDGWKEGDAGEDWEGAFSNESETILVLMGIRINETVEEAKQGFEREKQGFSEPNDYPIGDEGFWAERPDNARTYFRHSNAIGLVVGARESGLELVPDPGRSQNYAEEMYEHWGTLDTGG